MKNRFVDVTNDVAFRKIFGNENKTTILISFLNAILKLEGDKRIVSVTIANPYQLPRVAGEKASILDVKAVDEKGRQFIVEMQVADLHGFDKRVQYYACRDYSMQINRGEEYALLKPTYFIAILDFDYFESESYLSHHIIVNEETQEHKLTDIQFTFIELQKFSLKVDELKTLIEKWVFFIKEADELDVIPDNVEDEGLREAYMDAEKHRWSKKDLLEYDNFWIAIQDAKGRVKKAVDTAVAAAVATAVTETTTEVTTNKNREIVKSCLNEKMTINVISRITGLSEEEVLKIVGEIEGES